MSFEAAQPILGAMSACLPADLRGGQLDAARWAQWLKTADVQVRHRLDAGEEDTLTNLLRFGVTFTKEYRIDDEYFARYGESTLVDSFAEPFRIDPGRHVPGERRARPCPLVVPAGESVARDFLRGRRRETAAWGAPTFGGSLRRYTAAAGRSEGRRSSFCARERGPVARPAVTGQSSGSVNMSLRPSNSDENAAGQVVDVVDLQADCQSAFA